LQVAGDLAEQFEAKLIGIAACNPQPAFYASGDFAQSLVARHRDEIKQRMAETEERFRSTMLHRARAVEWRTAMVNPTEYVAHEARAADLIITSVNRDSIALDPMRRLDPSELVMQAGRPIFVVPAEAKHLNLQHALVAWKDTREARRAAADALPLLHKAKDVTIVEVIENADKRNEAQARVDDVAAWLGRHGITAFGRVLQAVEEKEQIEKIWEYGADLIVAGAYGHTRFRQWVFGGFTRSLLTRSGHCAFLAH